MYNLKKTAAAADVSKPYPKQLADKRDEFNQKVPDEGTTERQLAANVHKDKDASVPFNEQLSSARVGTSTGTLEKQLNSAPKLYNEKRDDTTHTKKVTAPNLVAEAYHQEKLKAFQKAQKNQDRDTSFWDKEVGAQMIGEKTKIVDNGQKSQLQNHPDRFKGLKPDLSTSKDFDELIMASLRDADRLQFNIFATAAAEGRKLTAQEQQQITDINSGKARVIASYEQKIVTAQSIFDPDPEDNYDYNRTGGNYSQQQMTGTMLEELPNPNAENPVDQAMQNENDVLNPRESNWEDPVDGDTGAGGFDYNAEPQEFGDAGATFPGGEQGGEHYDIIPDEKGYSIYLYNGTNGEGEPVGSFATEEEAHAFAERDPRLANAEHKPQNFAQEATPSKPATSQPF